MVLWDPAGQPNTIRSTQGAEIPGSRLSRPLNPLDVRRSSTSRSRRACNQISVILVEPTDGTPPLVRVHWSRRLTTAAATRYPAAAAAIVRIIAESATALARYKPGGQR